jgi:hypothetical protein
MATSKQLRVKKAAAAEKVGLLANGSAGAWDVAVDTATSGTERWFLQIEGPSIYFYFELASLNVVEKMAQFLEEEPTAPASNGNIVAGKDRHLPVSLVRDEEFDDRFFLVVGSPAKPVVQFTISGSTRTQLAEALRQAESDLADD